MSLDLVLIDLFALVPVVVPPLNNPRIEFMLFVGGHTAV